MLTHTPIMISATGEAQQPKETAIQPWQDNIRPPEVAFGRCALTGQWGKVVQVDLGDISIEAPNPSSAHMVNGEIQFSEWRPVVYSNQMTVSREGLAALLSYMDSQDNPIPAISPDLVYAWQVTYRDGDALKQYQHEGESEVEVNSNQINLPEVSQLSIVSHYDTVRLPTYTFVKETGNIYRDGELLDLMYDGEYDPEADLIYARKVHHTWGSQMVVNTMNRSITNALTTVKQLMGWKQGGLAGTGRSCIISVDEQGQWTPWEYKE